MATAAPTHADDFAAVHTLECVTRSADRRPPLNARAHSWSFHLRVVVCALKFGKTPPAAKTPPLLNGSDDRRRTRSFCSLVVVFLVAHFSLLNLARIERSLLLFLDGK